MATVADSINYRGNVIDFPLANPEENAVTDEMLHENLARPTTERTKRLKARCRWKHASAGEFIDSEVRAGIERMRFITEAHKASEGQPEVIRRALGLANILNKSTLVLQQDEFM